MTSFIRRLFGFEQTAVAAIKTDAAAIIAKAEALEPKLETTVKAEALVVSSIVGNTAATLIKGAGNLGASIDVLVKDIATMTEQLRQKRLSRAAVVAGLTALKDDPALTDAERTAVKLEIDDHVNDTVDAGVADVITEHD